ncbi:MAG: NAD(P)-binding domain-containing protein [Burkholderiales bacterium]|nr:NAD(P)-binding domain-containing protein [Burkholderiales bacterium]
MRSNDGLRTTRRALLQAIGSGIAMGVLPTAVRAAEAGLKVGIVGSGRIGGNLGEIWHKAGHAVMFSSRHIEHDRELAARLGGKARAGTAQEAAAFGEVVLMAVPYRALPELGKDLANQLKGKPVIDACNPFVHRDGDIAKWAREKGAGLASAELLPGALIVRAFNAISYARLPDIAARKGGDPTGMPIAGNDAKAIALASRLVRDAGFEPVLVGDLAFGRHLIPGTPLAGEHSPEEIRRIAATLS